MDLANIFGALPLDVIHILEQELDDCKAPVDITYAEAIVLGDKVRIRVLERIVQSDEEVAALNHLPKAIADHLFT